MAVSIQQAACNRLAAWLVTQLPGDVVVNTRWPEATVTLPPKGLTILLAGAPTDDLLDPALVAEVEDNDGSETTQSFVYRFRCRRQPLQIDIWSDYDAVRDDLVAALDIALNQSELATLGIANSEPVRNGLLLDLADGWTGRADFLFEGPNLTDDPDSEQTDKFRATWRGHVDMMLTIAAQSSKLAVIALEQRLKNQAGDIVHTDRAATSAAGDSFTQTP